MKIPRVIKQAMGSYETESPSEEDALLTEQKLLMLSRQVKQDSVHALKTIDALKNGKDRKGGKA